MGQLSKVMARLGGAGVGLNELQRPEVVRRTHSSPPPTSHQIYALEIVSLVCAIVSILTSVVAFYWFVRMRRSFRQDLIMLLIQSNMMKAFWFMVCPIAYVSSGPISTNDVLCQVSGFFLTSAIEAADISVLIIAIHSAVCILRPHQSGGETGLYIYRRYAYAFWFFVPVILAAVVPMTGHRFVYNGLYCYLPTEPRWYRMTLSWIPRYIVLGVIFLVYGWVYVYVGYRFRRLRLDQKRASMQNSIAFNKIRRSQPPTPSLDLWPEQELAGFMRDRQQSVASDMTILKPNDNEPMLASHPEAVTWNWLRPSHEDNSDMPSRRQGPFSNPTSPATVSFPAQVSNLILPPPAHLSSTHMGPAQLAWSDHTISRPLWRGSLGLASNKSSNADYTIISVLGRSSSKASAVEQRHGSTSAHTIQPLTDHTLRTSRNKMRWQLRRLFMYPIIYVIAWIAPFVSQVYRYGDPAILAQPYPLLMATIASLCIGAAVDCCFFSAWEKPWRHLQGGFWEGLVMRFRIGLNSKDSGRSREERLRDTMWALDRRVQENADRERTALLRRTRSAGRPREWWDLEEDENRASGSVNQV